jgi:DNA ligase (NAD+)
MNTAQLANKILRAKQAYYFSDSPFLTDEEYDQLENQLRVLEPSHPVLAMVGAPVPKGNTLQEAEHLMPMGSQSKVNTESEFRTWWTKSGIKSIHASLKGDGGSVGCYYQDGRLIQAITRGDGIVGEDITANVARFKGVPLWLSSANGLFNGSVRFEGILTVMDWKIADPTQAKNPRNAGNGIMRRKNGDQSDLITAYAFDIIEYVDGVEFNWETEEDKTKRLVELGFNVLENETFTNVEGAIAYFDSVTERRSGLNTWIDGVVFKSNDVAHQKSLGVADGRPRGQVSWKFQSEGAQSVLIGFEITGGHTGALIPNARFKPVEIGGTTVTNASLANFDEVARLDIAVGDTVWVRKSNDIIPQITHVISRAANRDPIVKPTSCPFCSAGVAHKAKSDGEDGVALVCINPNCPKKTAGKIQRWISSLDIQGIGDAVLDAMVDQMDVHDAGDLYALHKSIDRLAALVINTEKGVALGEKRAVSILASIDNKRRLSLDQFLGSLGITYLGKRRVEIMMTAAQGDLDSLDQWQAGRLADAEFAKKVGVPEVGAQVQYGIDSVTGLIAKLLANGVEITSRQKQDTTGLKTVCISGKLPSGKKKSDYAAPLQAKGYLLIDEVGKGLDFLVLADPTSSSTKSVKATKLGVEIISEDRLVEMCL